MKSSSSCLNSFVSKRNLGPSFRMNHRVKELCAIAALSLCLFPSFALGRGAAAPSPSSSDGDDGFHLTYDIGASTGSTRSTSGGVTTDRTYSEASLGINAFFSNWFAWRNAGFGRFSTGVDTVYGLDSSFRLMADVGDRQLGASAFLGPGYRFVTNGDSAPFAEAGLTIHLAGLSIGGGAKRVFNTVIRPNVPDDTQYFITLSGSGRL